MKHKLPPCQALSSFDHYHIAAAPSSLVLILLFVFHRLRAVKIFSLIETKATGGIEG